MKGTSIQGDRPVWGPLLDAVGERVTCDFMWMFEVQLADGTLVEAYKHIDTRGYLHLAADGTAYIYSERDRYRPESAADVLTAVIIGLPGLAGVTAEQIEASWEAVERLQERERSAASGAATDERARARAASRGGEPQPGAIANGDAAGDEAEAVGPRAADAAPATADAPLQ